MSNETEIWLPIPGYEREYEASNLGRIRSLRRLLMTARGFARHYGGRILVQNCAEDRALVTLSRENSVKTHLVNLLVCAAFHGGKPADKDVCAHWDGDGWNNRADNLRWATYCENEADKRRHDRHAAGERNPSAKLCAEEVAEIRRRHTPSYGHGAALAREFGVSKTQIGDIVKGRCWSDDGNAVRRKRRAAQAAQ